MRYAISVLLLEVFCATWCAASANAGENATKKLERPGVVLTFDDTSVAQWVAALPLFKKYNAHATFFVASFDRLNEKQLAGLHELEAAGHAIGCHGLRHLKAVDTVKKSSVQEYLKIEIKPALDAMLKAGFQPTCFAYPCSQHDNVTNDALAAHFRHLRSGIALAPDQTAAQADAIFTPIAEVSSRRCLIGTGIDGAGPQVAGGRRLDSIFAALDRAAKRNELVVFYAHHISDEKRGHHISPAILEKVLEHAASAGLAFYTYKDLP